MFVNREGVGGTLEDLTGLSELCPGDVMCAEPVREPRGGRVVAVAVGYI